MKKYSKISMSRTDFLVFLTIPTVFIGILIFDTHHSFFKFIAYAYTEFLRSVPSWSIPIAAPLSLLIVFLGLPSLVEALFKPRAGKILFSSMSLTFAILLINFMIVVN